MDIGYYCKECGATVEWKPAEGVFVRTCGHDSTIIAGMKATAKGIGNLNKNAE